MLIIVKFSLNPVMDNIIEPTIDFDFSQVYLSPPSSLTGGAYFTRLVLNNKPLYIHTPKCLTKQGFIKSGKKIYADLMFDNTDTIFIQWLENIESKCQDLIYAKSEQWFESALDKSDIETAFTSPIKIFKSGKYYLLRVNVKPNIKIYNEMDEIVPLDNVKSDSHIISIIEIQGIKFTSRNFQIELELKQSMIVSPDPFLDVCFIKKPSTHKESNNVIHVSHLGKTEQDKRMVLSQNNNPEININLEEETKIDLEETKEQETKEQEELESNELKEFDIDLEDNLETISLKKPNQVYYEIYKTAREKAKKCKQDAIIAFLEAKNIKKTYMLDDIEESDSDMEEELENLSEYQYSEKE